MAIESKITKTLEKKITPAMQDKWFSKYSKQARFMGNGVYSVCDMYSTSPRELFLMFAALNEGIPIPEN